MGNAIFDTLLVSHIAAGFTGLFSMAVPMVSKKGAKLHRVFGRIFAIAMGYASISAITLGVLRVTGVEPHSNGSRSLGGSVFLIIIGLLAGHLVWHGYRSATHRKRIAKGGSPRSAMDIVPAVTLGVAGLSLGSWGVVIGETLFIAFGAVCSIVGGQTVAYLFRQTPPRVAVLGEHASGMLGGSIAATTAFLVTNETAIERILFGGTDLPGIVLWLAPTVIGTPMIVFARRSLKRGSEQPLQRP